MAQALTITPSQAAKQGLELNQDGIRRSAYDLLATKDVGIDSLVRIWPELASIDAKTAERLETEARYAVYLDRQKADVMQMKHEEQRLIPAALEFADVPGLSNEIKHKLAHRQPRSLAEAQRIDGMTPAALAIIVSHIRHFERDIQAGAA